MMRVLRQFICEIGHVAIAGSIMMLLVLHSHAVVAVPSRGDDYRASSIDPLHHSTTVSGYGSHRYPSTCRVPQKLPRSGIVTNFDTPMYIHSQKTFTATSVSPSNSVNVFLVSANATASISAVSKSLNEILAPQMQSLNVSKRCHFDDIWANQAEMSDHWIPIEGIFGVYLLPSGFLIVWIVQSEPVYKAPMIPEDHQRQNRLTTTSWFEVYRVSELYLTHIAFSPLESINQPSKMPRGELLEEKRQLHLLRKSLKDHDWYYTKSDRMIIPDFTRNLQSCLLWGPSSLQTDESLLDDTVLASLFTKNDTSRVYSNVTQNKPESHFFWNGALLQPFVDAEATASNATVSLCRNLRDLIIPVTSAFFGVRTNISLDENDTNSSKSLRYDQILISRRSRLRAGTRFTRRGADDTGSVANFVETEQILILWKHQSNMNSCHIDSRVLNGVMSYVQTRGSIPLRWSSPTDVKTYRPRVRIGTDPMAQARAFRNHLVDYASRYTHVLKHGVSRNSTAQILMVNLIDKKSDQGRLGRAMDNVLKALLDVHDIGADSSLPWLTNSNVEHLWFDFHAEVKSGRWYKLVGLLEQVKPYLSGQSYFFAEPGLFDTNSTTTENILRIKKLQAGTIRTNCMDCLDRTNVVQSIFGRYILFHQLAEMKSFSLPFSFKLAFCKKPMTLPWKTGEVAHRHLWAENADQISRLYAGTAALKGDFTRTGKRTRKGALDDGLNSVQRYYLNNFLDAARQEGIDLLVGKELFSNVNEQRGDKTADLPMAKNNVQRMNIRDAALQVIVDDVKQANRSTNDGDHVCIKVKHPIKFRLFPRHLDLRWLPGDLQMQVRSLIAFSDHLSDIHKESLEDIDHRASSDMPWWVLPDSTVSE